MEHRDPGRPTTATMAVSHYWNVDSLLKPLLSLSGERNLSIYMTYMGNGLTTSVAQLSLWMGYVRGIENSRSALGYILLRKDGCLVSKTLLIFPSDKQWATTSANYQPELQQGAKQNIVGQTAAQIHLSPFTNKNFYSSPLLYRNPDYISEETKSYQQNPNVENLLPSRKVRGSGYCASTSRATYLPLGILCGNLTSCWKTINLKHAENNNSWQSEEKLNQMRMMLVSTRGKAKLNEIGSWCES